MTLLRFILVCCLAAASVGCAAKKPTTRSAEEFANPKWDQRPLPIQQSSVAVKEGTPPLVHLFEAGGPVRVIDTTANAQLAATIVGNRTLVSIDARRGVVAGSAVLVAGPLPADHRYAIIVDPTTENVSRQAIGLPERIDRPRSNHTGPRQVPTTGKLP